MWFDDKPAKEITEKEICGIIGQSEDQWLEFKGEGYRGKDDDGYEICKDITAMANAYGGYILVGVGSKSSKATGFHSVSKPNVEIDLIKSHCDKIEPRIVGLEVVEKQVEFNHSKHAFLVVRVPPSDKRPHGFYHKDRTIFVKREDDQIRRFPMVEIVDAITASRLPDSATPPIGLVAQPGLREPVDADDNALEEDEPERIAKIMGARFAREVNNSSYYRIFAVPAEPKRGIVDTDSDGLRQILQSPTVLRANGFGFRPMVHIKPNAEGIHCWDLGNEIELTLLRNGYYEVRYPLAGHHFQWKAEKYGYLGNWLYPYSVCEFPTSSLRVLRAILDYAAYGQELLVKQEYWGVKGFVLAGGHPNSPRFALHEWTAKYDGKKLVGETHKVPSQFQPDRVAYALVKEVYNAFGLDDKYIPLFDADKKFEP